MLKEMYKDRRYSCMNGTNSIQNGNSNNKVYYNDDAN